MLAYLEPVQCVRLFDDCLLWLDGRFTSKET